MTVHVFHLPVIFDNEFSKKKRKKNICKELNSIFLGEILYSS